MASLFLPAASLVAIAIGACALLLTRARPNGGEGGFPLLGAIAVVGGAVGLLLHAGGTYLPLLGDYCARLPWWLGAPIQGTVLGVALHFAWRVLPAIRLVYLWACRCRDEDETKSFWWRRHVWTAVAMAVMFTAIFAVDRLQPATASAAGLYKAFEWLVILIAITALPLYQTWVLPWILYYRARPLEGSSYGEVHEWLDHVRSTRKVPRFHLRVQEGKMVNALAAGGLRAYFIVLGRGLLDNLSTPHIKAVLAHEIGHVVNGDTTRRAAPLFLFCACLHMLYFHFVVLQFDQVWAQATCVGIGVPFFWVVLPGIVQRRWEYRADRKAVEIMGDAEVVAQSLERLYDVNNVDINTPGWPHPSLGARLRAIRAFAAQNAPAQS